MGSEPQQTHAGSDERTEQMVAYLDGELAAAEARDLDARSARNPAVKHEVESLRKTWALLDHLPRPKAPEDFGSRTITLLNEDALVVSGRPETTPRFGRPGARLAVATAVALLTAILGFALTRWAWPDRTARLAERLPLAEHWEEYRNVESFDFLKQLESSREFHEAD